MTAKPKDPFAPTKWWVTKKRKSGLDVCDLAAISIFTVREIIYVSISEYFKIQQEILNKGGSAHIPGVGSLKIKKMHARRRHDANSRTVKMQHAGKGIKISMSTWMKYYLGYPLPVYKPPRVRYNLKHPDRPPRKKPEFTPRFRGVSDEVCQRIYDATQIDVISVHDALLAWGDTAVIMLAAGHNVVCQGIGTLRVGKGHKRKPPVNKIPKKPVDPYAPTPPQRIIKHRNAALHRPFVTIRIASKFKKLLN